MKVLILPVNTRGFSRCGATRCVLCFKNNRKHAANNTYIAVWCTQKHPLHIKAYRPAFSLYTCSRFVLMAAQSCSKLLRQQSSTRALQSLPVVASSPAFLGNKTLPTAPQRPQHRYAWPPTVWGGTYTQHSRIHTGPCIPQIHTTATRHPHGHCCSHPGSGSSCCCWPWSRCVCVCVQDCSMCMYNIHNLS